MKQAQEIYEMQMSQVKNGKSSTDAAKDILGLIESHNTPVSPPATQTAASKPELTDKPSKSEEKDLLKLSEKIEKK